MEKRRLSRTLLLLLAGDALTLALVTLAGLATHQELGAWITRLWPTFLPLLAAWLLVAPHLQVYDLRRAGEARSLWRPFWAMVLAAPLGLFLRSLWLGTGVVLVTFTLVMGGLSALALLAWRSLWVLFWRQPEMAHAE